MLQLEADADIADELERVLYNAVLHSIALDGKSTYYRNPLTDKDHVRDNNWCCCPPPISRTISHVGRYAYGRTDEDIYVSLYIGGAAKFALKETKATLKVETGYPWKSKVTIAVAPAKPAKFALRLRMPAWSAETKLSVCGKPVDKPRIEKSYAVIERTGQPRQIQPGSLGQTAGQDRKRKRLGRAALPGVETAGGINSQYPMSNFQVPSERQRRRQRRELRRRCFRPFT